MRQRLPDRRLRSLRLVRRPVADLTRTAQPRTAVPRTQKGGHGNQSHGARRRNIGRAGGQVSRRRRSFPHADRVRPPQEGQDRDDLPGHRPALRADRGLRSRAHPPVRSGARRRRPGHRHRRLQLPGDRPARPRVHLGGAAGARAELR